MIVNGILGTKKNYRDVGLGGITCVWEVLGLNLVGILTILSHIFRDLSQSFQAYAGKT